MALVWILVVEVGLKVRPLPVLARWMGTRLDSSGGDCSPPPEATDAVFSRGEWIRIEAIDRMLRRWPFGDTCLRRSLLWGHTLRARQPRLRIGVARDKTGAIIAHSWLEFDHVSLGLDPDVAYEPLGWRGQTPPSEDPSP